MYEQYEIYILMTHRLIFVLKTYLFSARAGGLVMRWRILIGSLGV